MSPGIRSVVNCTRRVGTSSAAARRAHQQRLGHARARPRSARGRRTAARPAGRTRRRPGRRRPWRPRRVRRPAAASGARRARRRRRRRPARSGRSAGGPGSLTPVAPRPRVGRGPGQVDQGAVVGHGSVEQQPAHPVAICPCAATSTVTRVAGGVPGGRPRRSPSAVARAGPQRRGGMGAVVAAGVEAAAAQRGLHRAHDHRQRLGDQRPEPSAAPQHEREEGGAQQHSTRPTQGGSSVERDPVAGEGVGRRRRTRRDGRPGRADAARRRRCRRPGPGRWSAARRRPQHGVQAGARLGQQAPCVPRSSRPVRHGGAAVDLEREPGDARVGRRPAGPADVAGARGTAADGPERGAPRRSGVRRATSRRAAGVVAQPPVVLRPSWSVEVTTTVVPGATGCAASSASAPRATVDVDALVGQHAGDGLGAAGSGLSGSSEARVRCCATTGPAEARRARRGDQAATATPPARSWADAARSSASPPAPASASSRPRARAAASSRVAGRSPYRMASKGRRCGHAHRCSGYDAAERAGDLVGGAPGLVVEPAALDLPRGERAEPVDHAPRRAGPRRAAPRRGRRSSAAADAPVVGTAARSAVARVRPSRESRDSSEHQPGHQQRDQQHRDGDGDARERRGRADAAVEEPAEPGRRSRCQQVLLVVLARQQLARSSRRAPRRPEGSRRRVGQRASARSGSRRGPSSSTS